MTPLQDILAVILAVGYVGVEALIAGYNCGERNSQIQGYFVRTIEGQAHAFAAGLFAGLRRGGIRARDKHGRFISER